MALPRLPRPTRAFADTALPTVRVPKTQQWLRIHRNDFDPTYFGASGDGRFDPKDASFGVLYLARQINGCFVEVFCRQRNHHVSLRRIRQYHVAVYESSRNLRLVDLAGKGLVKLGLDARLASGSYSLSHAWSQAFYEHPANIDGILYPSRHDPKQQLAAVFDRSETLLHVSRHGSLDQYLGDDFYRLLDHYEITVS